MALLLDTGDVVAEARRDALHDAYVSADVRRQVSLITPTAANSTRIEAWWFGSMKLFSSASPGLDVVRSGPSSRLEPMIALCIQDQGTGLLIEDDREQRLMPGDMLMVGPTAPNEFVINGSTAAVEVPFDEIGVSVETAALASKRLPASSLFLLVSRHLLALRHEADSLSLSVAAETVGAGTVELIRAMIVSAAQDERAARSILGDTIAMRIFAYVRQHLSDPDLTPANIAQVHNISLQYLHKICNALNTNIDEWIIQERLEGARRDLSRPGGSFVSTSLVARRWGFKNASEFNERFSHAYSVSPKDFAQYSRHQYQITTDLARGI
jgi:AraC-like DNA-binding protein